MENRTKRAPLFIWWVIWLANLSGLGVLHLVLGDKPGPGMMAGNTASYVGLVPLLFSCALRWLVLPKQKEAAKALVIFVLGAAMAEGCGIIGIVLGGEHRSEFLLLGMLGVLQWMPLFAPRFYAPATGHAHGLRMP
jgi:hypothetical protein